MQRLQIQWLSSTAVSLQTHLLLVEDYSLVKIE